LQEENTAIRRRERAPVPLPLSGRADEVIE